MTATGTAVTAPPPQMPAGGTVVVQVGHGALLRAIEQDLRDNSVTVRLPGMGTVRFPALDFLAWLGGLAALAALEIIEWPVAAVIGVGHVLSHQQHLRLLHDFGTALEEGA